MRLGSASSFGHAAAAELDPAPVAEGVRRGPGSRWRGVRLRTLVVLALLGCLAVLLLARSIAALPFVGAYWAMAGDEHLQLVAASSTELERHIGKELIALEAQGIRVDLADATLIQYSPRWLASDAERVQQQALHDGIRQALAQPQVTLEFVGADPVTLPVTRRGITGLPAMFWLLCVGAVALYLAGVAVMLTRPSAVNLLYFVMALCQSGNLLFAAIKVTFDLGWPSAFVAADFAARGAFDLITVGAAFHAACLNPLKLPHHARLAAAGWAATAAIAAAAAILPNSWYWLQACTAMLAAGVAGLLTRSYQNEPRPLALALRRFSVLGTTMWVALSLLPVVTPVLPWPRATVATVGGLLWYAVVTALLLVTPLLSRSRQIVREFGLLAVIGVAAVALDLLFVDALSMNRIASTAIALTIGFAFYLTARRWLLTRLLGASMTTTELMFDRLYRIAREAEARPERTPKLLADLLGELFDPMEMRVVQDPISHSRLAADGSAMWVPVPALGVDSRTHDGAVVLRFARRGNRLFTIEDVRLSDRIVEQLERAVAYDRAVERGRAEERLRIAQDLHDDIGARLLTLIYKAQSPEMEEYVRHTLQDLKTLTRGLAAPSHRLSHAAGEWKADLTHRLNAASIDLGWSCEFDEDIPLSMVQWSAITRVLRELTSNAIAHSAAGRVEVNVRFERDCLHIVVCDDGIGLHPQQWAHGLGLSGVRKRVKQLNGQVEWTQAQPRGISCHVTVTDFSGRTQPD